MNVVPNENEEDIHSEKEQTQLNIYFVTCRVLVKIQWIGQVLSTNSKKLLYYLYWKEYSVDRNIFLKKWKNQPGTMYEKMPIRIFDRLFHEVLNLLTIIENTRHIEQLYNEFINILLVWRNWR